MFRPAVNELSLLKMHLKRKCTDPVSFPQPQQLAPFTKNTMRRMVDVIADGRENLRNVRFHGGLIVPSCRQ